MPDEITQVSYYIGTIPHKVGEGARILNAVKDASVNLLGFLGYPKSARVAEVVFVVDEKAPNLARIAKKAGLALGKKQKALLIAGEDRLGTVAEKMIALSGAGINIVSVHALAAGAGRYAALVAVAPADLRKAVKALAA
ncbi:MAG: hypothetical protein ABSH05_13180 [Bryobacteraceae bacterium]|jgi:DNA-binding phage protein